MLLSPALSTRMRAVDLIRKKRDSGELSNEEIDFLVSGYTRGEIPESEEHTSELQSRLHLVCRLLLEKKKKTTAALQEHDIPDDAAGARPHPRAPRHHDASETEGYDNRISHRFSTYATYARVLAVYCG